MSTLQVASNKPKGALRNLHLDNDRARQQPTEGRRQPHIDRRLLPEYNICLTESSDTFSLCPVELRELRHSKNTD